jgi:segregation and condensation protein A
MVTESNNLLQLVDHMEVSNYEKVLNYLMFNQSIIDDESNNEKIKKYMDLVKKVADGNYFHVEDLTDKVLLSLFDVIISEGIDPWEIDLTKFTEMYLSKIEKEKFDFIHAGMIIQMSWGILKMQCEAILNKLTEKEMKNEDILLDEWYDVLNEGENPTLPSPYYTPKTIGLIELLNELEPVIENTVKLNEHHREIKKESEPLIEYKIEVHKETITEDMNELLELLVDDKPVYFNNLCKNNLDNTIKYFIALLFLVSKGIVDILLISEDTNDILFRKVKKNVE